MPALGQLAQGDFESGRGADSEIALLTPQELLGIVALHHGHPPTAQI